MATVADSIGHPTRGPEQSRTPCGPKASGEMANLDSRNEQPRPTIAIVEAEACEIGDVAELAAYARPVADAGANHRLPACGSGVHDVVRRVEAMCPERWWDKREASNKCGPLRCPAWAPLSDFEHWGCEHGPDLEDGVEFTIVGSSLKASEGTFLLQD